MKSDKELIGCIACRMTQTATLEGLAEECAELAQGALKLARIIRGENPTTVTVQTAMQWVAEEMTDVRLYCDVLGEMGIAPEDSYTAKAQRWMERLNGRMEE